MADGYDYFDHEADIGIEVWGSSLERCFVQAARAMFAVMADPASVAEKTHLPLEFTEPDIELALVTWLNRLLAEARLHGLVFRRFALQQHGDRWRGEAWGSPWRPGADRGTEVKGATLTMLKVEQTDDGWRARCVVDV